MHSLKFGDMDGSEKISQTKDDHLTRSLYSALSESMALGVSQPQNAWPRTQMQCWNLGVCSALPKACTSRGLLGLCLARPDRLRDGAFPINQLVTECVGSHGTTSACA